MAEPSKEIHKVGICIIGAGPAGAAASITLTQQRTPHLILDAATFPRHKSCGDIMPAAVLRALKDLDPSLLETMKQNGLVNPIWRNLTYPPNGKSISIDFLPLDGKVDEPSCYSISRFDMDLVLVNKVKTSEYATVKENCRVVYMELKPEGYLLSTDQGESILAELVLVATGSNNNMLKFLGMNLPKKESAIGIRAHFKGIDCPKDQAELYLESEIMPGGLYITPLPNEIFNVNLVISLDKVTRENINLREVFENLIESSPVLKEKFKNAQRTSNFEGSMLFLGLQKRVISGERFMLLGDSAGLIEFFTGNGIPQALLSGKLAALQAVKSLESMDFTACFLQKYENLLYQKINKDYTTGRRIYPLLHKKMVSKLILRFLNHLSGRPKTNDMLRDLVYDKNAASKLRKSGFYYKLLLKKEA